MSVLINNQTNILISPIRKKKRMNDDNDNFNNFINIIDNGIKNIRTLFYLFLVQMNFDTNKVENIDFNLTFLFRTNPLNEKRKFILNKKLINQLIPIIDIDYKDHNNTYIESANCELYIDRKNNIIYKEFDLFSLLDMIQETFIQNILHSYLPNNIGQIYGIYKSDKKDLKYIYSQTYFENGTLHEHYELLNKKQLLNILISVCNQLNILQKEVHFLHNDFKINNICINIQKEEGHIIDFGYSSIEYNNQLICGHLDLHLDTFNKNKSLETYTKNKIMTHKMIVEDKYKYSSDLFYLIFTILYYYNSQFKNPLYDILYDLFDVKISNYQKINIFDEIYALEKNTFEHASFFMTKSNELFTQYFGSNILNIDEFYERFLPQNLSNYLSGFLQ